MTPKPESAQGTFVNALLDPDLPPPNGLKAWHGERPIRRFAVYRNNLIGGLIEALEERFPVCLRLVGEEFFHAMAQSYVRASLPCTPVLLEYGQDFADFISAFGPARELPYLPDVAWLEYAMGRAYHAADAVPLSREFMRSLQSDRLDSATVSLHPSIQLISSKYPIVSIWRANLSHEEPMASLLDHAQDALVVRPRLEVETHILPDGGLAFVGALADGATFSAAANSARRVVADFDLTECLRVLLASEAFVAIRVEA
jgi:hypothetical protein